MKKLTHFMIVLLGILMFFQSCSNNEEILLTGEETAVENRAWQIADSISKYFSLGFSYDITKGYVNDKAVKYAVVNADLFIQANSRKFYTDEAAYGTTRLYSGATAEEFSLDVATNYSIANDAKFPVKLITMDANMKFGVDIKSSYSYSTKYSYSRIELLRVIQRVKLVASPLELQNYLEHSFIEDVNTLTADQIIQKYGTHVLLNIAMGGKLNFDYRAEILETTSSVEKKFQVETGLKASFLTFGGGTQYSVTNDQKESTRKKTGDWELFVDYFGGTNSGVTSIVYNPETGYPTTTFSPKAWEESVNERNACIVDIDWKESYPIYEFIADPAKKQAVEEAFQRYIDQIEVIEVIEVMPLYRLYSNKKRNSSYTEDLDEAIYYVNNKGYFFDYGVPKRSYIQGYVFKTQQPNTVPLYRLYNNSKQNSSVTNDLDEANHYVKTRGYFFDYGVPSRTCIIGYVYKTQQPNTVALYRLHSDSKHNTCITNSLDEANYYVRNKGYYFDYGAPKRTYIQGYVLP